MTRDCRHELGDRSSARSFSLGGWGGQGKYKLLFQNLGERTYNAKYTQREVDPQRFAQSRRRFLRNAGIGAASLPFLGSLADTADAAASAPTKNPWPSYPAYKFAFVCHVTADVFFNAVRAGASDMCALLDFFRALFEEVIAHEASILQDC
jgi:hypothetical protein